MEELESHENWFANYRKHWIGFAVISLLYSVINVFTGNSSFFSVVIPLCHYYNLYILIFVHLDQDGQ
jgi:hypothetical protein